MSLHDIICNGPDISVTQGLRDLLYAKHMLTLDFLCFNVKVQNHKEKLLFRRLAAMGSQIDNNRILFI